MQTVVPVPAYVCVCVGAKSLQALQWNERIHMKEFAGNWERVCPREVRASFPKARMQQGDGDPSPHLSFHLPDADKEVSVSSCASVLVLSRAVLPSHRQQLIAHTFHVSKHVGFPGSPERADS